MTDIVERLRKKCGCNFPETTCMAESECADAFEAANEITRLHNELLIAEVWSARIIAGTQQDVMEIARLRAEVERLKAVEADYDLHEREMIDLEEDNGRLTADNEKLRAALELFACDCKGGELCFNTDNCRNYIARAALEGK